MKWTLTFRNDSAQLQSSIPAPIVAWNPTICIWGELCQQVIVFFLSVITALMVNMSAEVFPQMYYKNPQRGKSLLPILIHLNRLWTDPQFLPKWALDTICKKCQREIYSRSVFTWQHYPKNMDIHSDFSVIIDWITVLKYIHNALHYRNAYGTFLNDEIWPDMMSFMPLNSHCGVSENSSLYILTCAPVLTVNILQWKHIFVLDKHYLWQSHWRKLIYSSHLLLKQRNLKETGKRPWFRFQQK